MTIRLWKGYHDFELAGLVAQSWDENVLLIPCPPLLQDFSFLSALPEGSLEFYGQWNESERKIARAHRRNRLGLLPRPILGVFTSGTLSESPRLVLYSKRNLVASLEAIYALFDISRIEHIFCYPQPYHTFGLTLGLLAAHLYRWKLHTPHGKYSSEAHLDRLDLRESKVLTLGTPTHFFDLLKFVKAQRATLQSSYSAVSGGAGVSRDLWRRIQSELQIEAPSIGYGCSEASPGITHLPPGLEPETDFEVGFPLTSLQSEISSQGVQIEGRSLCMALIQNGEIEFPRKLLIRDHLEVTPSGRWLFKGRLDLLMNRGGAKLSLEAIEKTLHDQLGLETVACTIPDERLGEELGLVIRRSHEFDAATTRKNAQGVLKEFYSLRLKEKHIRILPDFPMNECSKLDRKSLWTLFSKEETLPQ